MEKRYFKKTLVISIVSLFFGASVVPSMIRIVSADDNILTFTPTGDTEIAMGVPDYNMGSAINILIRNRYGAGGSDWWEGDILIKFDLSSIPSGSTILSASLNMYFFWWKDNNPAGRDLNLYRIIGDWEEKTVTWNTQPSYASQPTTYSTVPGNFEWMTWDVTNDVQNFIDGTTNYGWKITDENYWGSYNIPIIGFRAKEYGDYIPYLEVTLSGVIHPPEWRNQGQNKSTIQPGESISLYAQGRDDVALDYAWLATNESSVWKNYTYDWWNTNWLYRKQITIDHGKVEDNLSNFPVLIFNTSLDFAYHVQPDGDDFVFISDDNLVKFNHEIESYNSTTGELIAWVNITSLSSTGDTKVWLYYGNDSCASQQDPTGTWDSYYRAVWHMSDKPTDDKVHDSTGNYQDSISKNSDPAYGQTGRIYHGINYDVDDGHDLPDDIQNTADASNGFTFEAWVKFDTLNDNANIVAFYKHGMELLRVALKGSDYVISFITENEAETQQDHLHSITPLTTDTWYYIVATFNGTDKWIYINSTNENHSTQLTPISDGVNQNRIGNNYGNKWNHGTQGTIDEIRFSLGTGSRRSDAWIKTSYNTMSSPQTFVSLGEEELLTQKYGSPMKMQENDQWQWSNFTWQNSSIPSGIVVGWRIYYIDTNGNVNRTDIMSFQVGIPTIIAVDGGKAVWRSTDFGENWTEVNSEYDDTGPKAMVSDSSRNLYIITATSEITKSTDNGENWAVINSDYNGGEVKSDWLAMTCSKSDDYLYIIEKSGDDVWRSIDLGITWTKVNDNYNGGVNPRPKGAAADSDGNIFVVDGNADVWKSSDYGITWTKINDDYNGPRNNYAADYVIGDDVHYIVMGVGGASYVYKSTDDGDTFTDMGKITQFGGAQALVYSDGKLYGAIFYGNGPPEIHRSDDGATSWSLVGEISTAYHIKSMTVT